MNEIPLETSCEAVKAQLDREDDLFLLDCRERDEFEVAALDGAVLVPMSELQERLGELVEHRDRQVIVFCHLGGRSLQVATWLRQQGFSQAQSMSGGIDRSAQEIEPAVPRY